MLSVNNWELKCKNTTKFKTAEINDVLRCKSNKIYVGKVC